MSTKCFCFSQFPFPIFHYILMASWRLSDRLKLANWISREHKMVEIFWTFSMNMWISIIHFFISRLLEGSECARSWCSSNYMVWALRSPGVLRMNSRRQRLPISISSAAMLKLNVCVYGNSEMKTVWFIKIWNYWEKLMETFWFAVWVTRTFIRIIEWSQIRDLDDEER